MSKYFKPVTSSSRMSSLLLARHCSRPVILAVKPSTITKRKKRARAAENHQAESPADGANRVPNRIGTDLFVENDFGNSMGEYTTSGGTVNPSFITGLEGPIAIAITPAPTPEPGTLALVGTAAAALVSYRWRRRGRGGRSKVENQSRTSSSVFGILLSLAVASSANASQVFSYSGSIQTYTVPATGTYAISVSGAQGGQGNGTNGGLGAAVSGDLSLVQGAVLDVRGGRLRRHWWYL